MKRQYDAFTDEELIEQLRDGDSAVMDFLMEKYKYLVRKKANAVFLLGGDTDDLVQEGMIGLLKAIREYDPARSQNFEAKKAVFFILQNCASAGRFIMQLKLQGERSMFL